MNSGTPSADYDNCDYCHQSFPVDLLVYHGGLCEANPINHHLLAIPDHPVRLRPQRDPLEDEGRNLVFVIGKEQSGKTAVIHSLIEGNGVITPNGEFGNTLTSFNSSTKKYLLMEPNGNIQSLIYGFSLADIALIVIDSTADFKSTHRFEDFLEECSIAKALGVRKLICCFSKVDRILFSKEQFSNLKNQAASYLSTLGYKVSDIPFVPVSAHEQENIKTRTDRLMWYKGFTLLKQLDEFAVASKVSSALRMVVHTANAEPGDITARVHYGRVMRGDNLSFHPGHWCSRIQAINMNGEEAVKVRAGELVDLVVKGPLDGTVKPGSVISSSEAIETPDPVKEALSFTAEIMVVSTATHLTPGLDQLICTSHRSEFTVLVSTISNSINRRTGKPNLYSALKAGDIAMVDFVVLEPVVVEKENKYHSLGCVTISTKDSRTLLAIGSVTDVETELVEVLPKPAAGSSRLCKLPGDAAASSSSAGKVKKAKNKRR